MEFKNTAEFAARLDHDDRLSKFRPKFFLPRINNSDVIYLCGNSLGLQPKSTPSYIQEELQVWQDLAVEGHFKATNPWLTFHKQFKDPLAMLVGSLPEEVVAMNSLTTNLHLMMISFYRPDLKRFKIIAEEGAFSSDMYALESQVKYHGLNPDEAVVEIKPREGEETLRTEDIIKTIELHNDTLALVLLGGVHYYTGQLFDIEAITRAAHLSGAYAGFDLAHAIGNVVLQLHKWEVDFAVWCSYKYLNGGPGGTAGAFVNIKHGFNPQIPRFAGWWGHSEKERFKMESGFIPAEGADGWQLSNAPILSMAALKASLDIFDLAGMENLRRKSIILTGYLHFLIQEIDRHQNLIHIITPSDPSQRGCQLSLSILVKGREVFQALTAAGVIADWREPNVIRIAPVPLYNTFSEVYNFSIILKDALNLK